MNPQQATVNTQAATIYKSGLYWRKGFISFLCPPGILSLENGQIKFRTKDSVIFDAPLTQCSFKFTTFGEMKITIGDKHYDLMGSPGAYAKPFDKSLRDELSQINQQLPSYSNVGGSMVGGGLIGSNVTSGSLRTASEAVEGIGAAIVLSNAIKGINTVGNWIPILQSQNVQITGKTLKGKHILVFIIVGIIIVFIGLIIIGSLNQNGN